MRIPFLYSLVLFAAVLPQAATSQTLSYAVLAADATAPSPRVDGAITYDSAGRQIFMFGGQDSGPRNDLWAYSLQRRQWSQVQVAGTVPPARFGHTLTFDPVRRRLILFGGQAGGFFSDTWAFDIAAGRWDQVSPDNAGPSRRYGHSAVYETTRDRVVISHGFTNSGRFDDTWAFDLRTSVWSNLSPSAGRPLRRCLHDAAYDPAANRMYLYGGCASPAGPCPLGDLWAFDLNRNQWTELTTPVAPPAREHYGMAFDSSRGRLVVFGGAGPSLLNDTWEYDPASRNWQRAAVSGPAPSPRQRHETAFAEDRGAIFFFGGATSAGSTNELWMLTRAFIGLGPQFQASAVVNALSFQPGPVAPGEIVSIFGSGLGPLNGVAFAFDPQTGTLPASGPGVSAAWNGIAAPLYFAREDQLNVQVPYELNGASEATLVVTVNGQSSAALTIPVVAAAPGLYPSAWNEDGTVNAASNAARRGSVVVLFATGQGVTNPVSRTGSYPGEVYPEPALPVILQIGGHPAEVVFRGQAPGTAGIMQINARIPNEVAPGGQVPVVLRIGDTQSQAGVSLAVR